jgi:carboxypeptidase Taq
MTYQDLQTHMQRIADVVYAASALAWDQETYLPEKGADFRAGQLSSLMGISHEMFTGETTGKLLNGIKTDKSLDAIQKRNIELVEEEYIKQKKYTTGFVEQMSHAVSSAFNAWQQAKKDNNYKLFAPHLQKLIDLKKRECDILGYKDHPYNAQLDLYEKKLTVADLDILFADVKKQLVPFIKQIFAAKQVDNAFFFQHYDKDKQWSFGIDLLKQMGFDFSRGRQDISAHPFTTTLSPDDVRVTTRVNEKDFSEMIWSCIHEGGHALYEQGLPSSQYGMPISEAVSLGIHESQSRLWENNVGRSLVYWKQNILLAKSYFPEQLKNVSAEDFFKGMNRVEPSLIRTNADELTYHSHIMIRYEIEKAIFENKVKVDELPELWNSKYKEYLGIEAKDFAHGVLQDVHWSHGSFGYFPTYSLGSFYAAQFFDQAMKDIPGLQKQIEDDNFKELLNWLRKNIHVHGKFYTAQQLCERITGEKLNFSHFMNYAKNKYGAIYNL